MLQYYYGNQIVGSTLYAHADGTIEHDERTCCPPTTVAVTEVPLDETQRASLARAVAAVAATGHETSDGGPAAHGSSGGELTVFDAEGTAYVVRSILRTEGANLLVTHSLAPEADWIEDLVASMVDRQMPR